MILFADGDAYSTSIHACNQDHFNSDTESTYGEMPYIMSPATDCTY
jgi:hypothetical protein